MKTTYETAPSTHASTTGDEAFEIIDTHRRDVGERFRVDPLDAEFPRLSHQLGDRGLYLARTGDNLAGAFKWRGALVGAVHLRRSEAADTLVVPSAGNHARGAILAAKILDMDIHVVVPSSAPPNKKDKLAELWQPDSEHQLTIHAVGAAFDDSLTWALDHPELGALLHPYDDLHVAAGQGTLVDDVLEAQPDAKHLVMPVGGGGLVAGTLRRLEELERQDILVHAVVAPGSDSLPRSLEQRQLIGATQPNRRYGGSAVHKIGAHALAVCQQASGLRIVTVSDAEVDIITADYEQDRIDLERTDTPNYEPTALVALAGLHRIASEYKRDTIVSFGTGHNDSLWQRPNKLRRVFVASSIKDNDFVSTS